jgi:MFS family permease
MPRVAQADSSKWVALSTVALGYFAVQLAMTAVPPMLPTVAQIFEADVARTSWAMTAYFLTITGCMLMAGRLGDLLGYTQIFAWGMVVYSLATLACGLAQSMAQLIVWRGLQGIGGALVFGNSLALVTSAFPASQRGRAVGALAMVSALGAMLGTVLGWVAVHYDAWRWGFFLVVPLGSAAAFMAFGLGRRYFSLRAQPTAPRRRFDSGGGIFLLVMLSALSLGLSHLHGGEPAFSVGWLYHLPLLSLAAYCLIAFVVVERQTANPLVPLERLRNGVFTGAILGNLILHMTMLGVFFLTPFFMERGLQMAPGYVAVLLTSQQFYNVLTSYASGWLYDRTHSRWIRPVGMALICGGFFLLGLTAPLLTFTTYMLIALPIGLGMGIFMAVNNTVIMSAVPAPLRGFASGMLETTRQAGHMFAVPLTSAIMTAVTGATLTAQTSPGLYIQGFQASCLVVGGIALVAVVLAFIPEGRRQGLAKDTAAMRMTVLRR